MGWLAIALGAGGCATRPADSAALDARAPDAPVDGGAADALGAPEVDSSPTDVTDAEAQEPDTLLGDSAVEAASEDATDADGDAAAPECTPGETRGCYHSLVPGCGLYPEVFSDGGPSGLTVVLCPAPCDEHQARRDLRSAAEP